MIKKAYYNLNLDKKKSILKSARYEFENYPLYKASINRIIKDCNIARGTFYLYFDSIEDIYLAVLLEEKEKFGLRINKYLLECNGDIFKTFILLYEYLVSLKGEDKLIYKNMVLNMNDNLQSKFIPFLMPKERPIFYNNIDFSKFRDDDKITVISVITMLMEITIKSAARNINNHIPNMKKIYLKKIEIIEKGISK